MLPTAVKKSSTKIKMNSTAKEFNSESLTVESSVAREIVVRTIVEKIDEWSDHDGS